MVKPIITYISVQKLFLDISVVQKKIKKTEYVNWKDKREFTDYVDSLYVPSSSDCYVFVKCHCDTEFIFLNKAEISETSLTCSCGQKIIEYSRS